MQMNRTLPVAESSMVVSSTVTSLSAGTLKTTERGNCDPSIIEKEATSNWTVSSAFNIIL